MTAANKYTAREKILGALQAYKKASGQDADMATVLQSVDNSLKVKEMRFFQDALCDTSLDMLVAIVNECKELKEGKTQSYEQPKQQQQQSTRSNTDTFSTSGTRQAKRK